MSGFNSENYITLCIFILIPFFFLRLRFKCFPLVISFLTWYRSLVLYIPIMYPVSQKIRGKMHLGIKENGTSFWKEKQRYWLYWHNLNKACWINSTVLKLTLIQRCLEPLDFIKHPGSSLGLLPCTLSRSVHSSQPGVLSPPHQKCLILWSCPRLCTK